MISWTVYVDHINANNRIAKHNVFDHAGFFEDCQKNYKKNKEDKDDCFDASSSQAKRSMLAH